MAILQFVGKVESLKIICKKLGWTKGRQIEKTMFIHKKGLINIAKRVAQQLRNDKLVDTG